MISDKETLFVWVYLPEQHQPTLCGRVSRLVPASGHPLGEFVYRKAYLESTDAIAIDPILLPLIEKPNETTLLNGHFSAVLDAGPDAWGRREIDEAYGKQTDLAYLLYGAGDQVGALAFSAAANLAPLNSQFCGFLEPNLDELLLCAELLETDQPIPPKFERLLKLGTSAGGARPKATLWHEGSQWLAKFPSVKDAEDLASNPRLEKTALDLAQLVGLNVPMRKLLNIGSKDVLLVERFDRYPSPHVDEKWCRRHFVSARTVFYSKPEVQRYAYTGSYQRLSLELASWSTQTKKDRVELYKRIVFNCLVNNLDDHDLNHGFICGAHGFQLSPLYDVVPQRPSQAVPRLALNFGKNGGIANKANLLSECEKFGLTTQDADQLIEKMYSIVAAEWQSCMRKNGIATVHIDRMAGAFCPSTFRQ